MKMHVSPLPGHRGPLARRPSNRLPGNSCLPAVYRLLQEVGEPTPRGPLARDMPLAMVEAVLLIADEPLPARRLAQAAGLADAADARRLVRKLQALYDENGSAFQVEELAGGYQLLTRSEYHRWLIRLRRGGLDVRLTPAARETLAIVAYRQPITRADVEVIRGVHCGEILRLLMERGLLRIAGRHDSLGRPVLYGTTRKFLQVFGLKSIKDLPTAEGLSAPPQDKLKEEG